MATNEDNKMGITRPVPKATPHEKFAGSGDMNFRLNQLQDHYEDQMDMVNGMTTGQVGGDPEGETTVVVPQFNTFAPAGPNGPNQASQNFQRTNMTAIQQGWQDDWAHVKNEPTVEPPIA